MMVYSTTDNLKALYIKEMLEEQKIFVVLFDKLIHPYGEGILSGEISLYVHFKQAEEALDFIYNLPE
ncbi:MAG: DUF2007 domain-containing protein [Saprospiraceae bacterium]|nr:DUF2007 domain-containing protein [Bacteroidota bacterium]MBK8345727.1 DUF2007 domain-containing protein [Bacteroidota bacterium]MBK9962973.1 DUF2007 domain-containing protein [Candidatus Vicinibacter affinis]